jgi:hypothetical protein
MKEYVLWNVAFSKSVIIIVIINNNSRAFLRERTIPTERPPLVGEISADFCG